MSGGRLTDDRAQLISHRIDAIVARFPDRFTHADLTQIRREIERLDDAVEVLRAYPLVNSDEPALIYRPYRQEG